MYQMLMIAIATGMRTLTPIAVLSWFAYLGMLPQTGWAFWLGHPVSVCVFTILAVGEYVGDTLPQTPNRTAPGPLVARLCFAALATAMAARATMEPAAGGVLFGLVGAPIGAYGGMKLRMWASRKVGHDLPVALFESALALGIAIWAAWMLYGYHLTEVQGS
jgi:uncharacterized membrane protein